MKVNPYTTRVLHKEIKDKKTKMRALHKKKKV
jgi:hypothetical protein